MKVFALFTTIMTAVMINQMLSFGLFKKPTINYGQATNCNFIEITPLDIQQYKNELLFLSEDGIYNDKQEKLYEENNNRALYSDDKFIYLCHHNRVDIILDWKIIQTIKLPDNLIIFDFIVIGEQLLLTVDYNVSDLIGFYFKTQSFALLQCDFNGQCNYIYEITGVHLSGIEYYDNNIIILDTFGKTLKIFNLEKELLQSFDLDDGPRRLVKYDGKLFITAIPKLLELLTLPKFTSLLEFKNNQLKQIVLIENFYYAGVITEDKLILGNKICNLLDK